MNLAATVMVLNEKGEVLVVSRKETKHETFGLPGGKVDPSESTMAAAARELYEETGISPWKTELVPIYAGECNGYWTVTYVNRSTYHSGASGDLLPEPGHILKFLNPDFLGYESFSPYFNYNRQAVQALYEYYKTINHPMYLSIPNSVL